MREGGREGGRETEVCPLYISLHKAFNSGIHQNNIKPYNVTGLPPSLPPSLPPPLTPSLPPLLPHSTSLPHSHPVIRKVFVHNLPHLRLLSVQNVGGEVENDVQHGRLRCQRCTAVLWIGVRGYLEREGERGREERGREGGREGGRERKREGGGGGGGIKKG